MAKFTNAGHAKVRNVGMFLERLCGRGYAAFARQDIDNTCRRQTPNRRYVRHAFHTHPVRVLSQNHD
jgi:hypothetical protein